jgi:signal transduction histidine kinase
MRTRLTLAFILLILITLAGTSIFVRESTANQIRLFVNRGGEAGLDTLVGDLESYYQVHQSWQGSESLLSKNTSGSSSGNGRGVQGHSSVRLADAVGQQLYPVDGTVLTQAELDNGIKLEANQELVGYLLLPGGQAVSNGNLEKSLLTHLDGALWRAALISGLAALLLAFGLSGVFMKSIGQLTRAAASLAKGNLDERVPENGAREIKTLAATFNQMATALQKFETNRKAMTADIAHELRTPLAVQKINLEALQDGIYPLTLESLQPIIDQNELLTHLVQDLRTLSLAEAGELTLEKSRLEVLPILRSLQGQFQQQAQQHQINLMLSTDCTDLRVWADSTRVAQILTNLLQNALRHTPAGCQVILSCQELEQQVGIVVRDTGDGIPEADLPYVFERFYKVDKSRSRSEGGSGLGLAIAKQLAELNGGSLTVENHAVGGAIFTLILPKAN